jgi:hypothetical protein
MATQVHLLGAEEQEPILGGLDFTSAPRAEARGLFALVRGNVATAEGIRELIDVSPRIQRILGLYAMTHPEEERYVRRIIDFRRRVREEFDHLIKLSLTQTP